MKRWRRFEENPPKGGEGIKACDCDCDCNNMIPTMCSLCIGGNHKESQECSCDSITLCPSCKAELTADAKACWNCGREFR